MSKQIVPTTLLLCQGEGDGSYVPPDIPIRSYLADKDVRGTTRQLHVDKTLLGSEQAERTRKQCCVLSRDRWQVTT